MKVSLEDIITRVVKEVVTELIRNGVEIDAGRQPCNGCSAGHAPERPATKTERIDMTPYKSPLLTESHIKRLHALTGRIEIPRDTIITPKAKELIKRKQITVIID